MAASSTLITVAPAGAEAGKSVVPAVPVTLSELVIIDVARTQCRLA